RSRIAEPGEPRALLGHARSETAALAPARAGEPVERLRPAGEDRVASRHDDGLWILFDSLDDAAHGEKAIEPRRRDLGILGDVARQVAHQRDDLVEHRAIDANRRRHEAGDAQRRRDIAAAAALPQGGAQLRLQRLETGRQAKAQFERAAVDAAQFPDPGDAVGLALAAGEAGHAGDAHPAAPSVVRGALIPATALTNTAAAAARAGQNAFGNPACFKTAFAVCRDLI